MISRAVRHLKIMPHWLAFIGCACVIFGAIMVSSPLGMGEWTNIETGEKISRAQIWENGMALQLFAVGFGLLFLGLGIFRRINVVRYLLPLACLAVMAMTLRDPEASQFDFYGLILVTLLTSWYFLKKASVRDYFKRSTRILIQGD